MIGVICKSDQGGVACECFELFKTPWEFYVPGRSYDVVIATSDELADVDAKLLIVCGAEEKKEDVRSGIKVRSKHRGGLLNCVGTTLPIYGDLAIFDEAGRGRALLITASGAAGVRTVSETGGALIRLGYDVFEEIRFLLSVGQPIEQAHIPTLDLHIDILRRAILSGGISFFEITPAPAGYAFAVCLTHDIDFVGIRNHKLDHTMWGFIYRSTAGGIRDLLRGRISWRRLFRMWRAVASLPLVFLGWLEDFWEPFGWYLGVEKNLPATYFLIPFKGQTGERVPGPTSSRRATTYDVTDLSTETATLLKEGCEIGVHGIDSWHSVAKGRNELARVRAVTGTSEVGIRMHWLLGEERTAQVVEEAGYAYDSTAGYNETIGYRSGTSQVFRPLGAKKLLELPLHIQDGALFYAKRLDLAEPEAWKRCAGLIENSNKFGGVLTLLWHDRSHGPERFWGEFYVKLLQQLQCLGVWFGTGAQVVHWFRRRREVRFEQLEATGGSSQVCLHYAGAKIDPPLKIRLYRPDGIASGPDQPHKRDCVDICWNGEPNHELGALLETVSAIVGNPSKLVAPTQGGEVWSGK